MAEVKILKVSNQVSRSNIINGCVKGFIEEKFSSMNSRLIGEKGVKFYERSGMEDKEVKLEGSSQGKLEFEEKVQLGNEKEGELSLPGESHQEERKRGQKESEIMA